MIMPYTAEETPIAQTTEELRARIPGWGVDLDPRDRPAFPKEQFDPSLSGAHWHFPQRQETSSFRERSIEHKFLTPVFGTAAPLKGLSGVMRKHAYSAYSEGRAAHWLLLLAADRVDAVESHVASLFTGHPDNLITETGIKSEFTHHGLSSRIGTGRADLKHAWLDPLLVAGPWVIAGGTAVAGLRALRRRTRRFA